MKQIIQNLNSGETSLIDVPAPAVVDGHLLIQTTCSIVSSGTERMLKDFGEASWLNKARQQPERLKEVFDKIKTDGLGPTIDAVKSKINKPIALGYANAGIVIAVGANVHGFKVGDRVVSNGAHAELVHVPQNLVAKIPDTVPSESAAFSVIGAIALQGIRLLQPTFGETVVVMGLGLIGQMAVQLLLANGCRVIGIDIDEDKCAQAQQWGIQTFCTQGKDSIAPIVLEQTLNIGADAVLITAAAKDDTLLADAAQMSRKRGRIVLVGVVNLNINRADFYEKELSFQVSCSYGPGRYDYDFEQNGNDYPVGFVRWTAKRNFEAVLQAMASGQLVVEPLISKKLPLANFEAVYDKMNAPENSVVLFQYEAEANLAQKITFPNHTPFVNNHKGIAIIGAGAFAAKVIVPELHKAAAQLQIVASRNGLSAVQLAQKYKLPQATTNLNDIWADKNIHTVVIATEHDSHADLCIAALAAGKNVFVEKPLAISFAELEAVKNAYLAAQQIINVGFNRRFAPLAIKAKSLIGGSGKLNIHITVNAGALPGKHWLNDSAKSGGRLVGELCHFIDLVSFFTDTQVQAICTNALGDSEDDVSVLLRMQDGSAASIHYYTNGSKAYDKERIEIFGQGKTLIIENWKRLTAYGCSHFKTSSTAQNKGHVAQFQLLKAQIDHNSSALIPFHSLYNTSAAALAAVQSLQEQRWVSL